VRIDQEGKMASSLGGTRQQLVFAAAVQGATAASRAGLNPGLKPYKKRRGGIRRERSIVLDGHATDYRIHVHVPAVATFLLETLLCV